MHPAAQISSELKNCCQLKNVQQYPSFLRLSDPGCYRGERCLFASRVTSTWLIASSHHQFTKVNNQRGNVEIGKIWDNNQVLSTWLRFSRCFFANENTMSSQINFIGQKSSKVYPKISKSLIPTNPVQICAVQQDQHLGIYVCVRAVHTYIKVAHPRDDGSR